MTGKIPLARKHRRPRKNKVNLLNSVLGYIVVYGIYSSDYIYDLWFRLFVCITPSRLNIWLFPIKPINERQGLGKSRDFNWQIKASAVVLRDRRRGNHVCKGGEYWLCMRDGGVLINIREWQRLYSCIGEEWGFDGYVTWPQWGRCHTSHIIYSGDLFVLKKDFYLKCGNSDQKWEFYEGGMYNFKLYGFTTAIFGDTRRINTPTCKTQRLRN